VAGLTALTLLHLSECCSVTDDGMRAVTTSLTTSRVLAHLRCEGGALEGDEGCTTRWCSVVAGHAALWYCSGGYTARLGGPPREALSTPSHCGACAEGRHRLVNLLTCGWCWALQLWQSGCHSSCPRSDDVWCFSATASSPADLTRARWTKTRSADGGSWLRRQRRASPSSAASHHRQRRCRRHRLPPQPRQRPLLSQQRPRESRPAPMAMRMRVQAPHPVASYRTAWTLTLPGSSSRWCSAPAPPRR
jgi:hypothetical protein